MRDLGRDAATGEAADLGATADVAPRLRTKLERLATAAFHLLGCRDYARVDFRVSATGKPYILEVNPNPDFSLSAGFANGLRSAGLTHAGFTVDLVRRALSRGKKAADEVTCETAG